MTIPLVTGYIDPSSPNSTLNTLIAQINGALPAVGITIPIGAIGIYSVVAVNGYTGPCLRVKRSSDNAQTDIPFSNGIADWVTADGFAAGSTLTIQKIYDQSGNSKDLVPATATPPTFNAGGNWNGIRPFGFFTSAPATSSNMIVPVTMNANSFAVYQVLANYTGDNARAFWSFQDTPANGAEPCVAYLPQGTPLNIGFSVPGASGQAVGFIPPIVPISAGFSGSGFSSFNRGSVSTTPATSAKLGQFCLGGSNVTSFYWMYGGIFFTAVYPVNHGAAQQASINDAALFPFVDATIKNKQITYGGSSFNNGFSATLGFDLPHQAGFGRNSVDNTLGLYALPALPDWVCRDMGVTGQTIATEITSSAAAYSNTLGVLPAGYSKNIIFIGEASNDIANSGGYISTAAAQTAMTTLWGTVTPYITALLTAGFTGVVVPTTIPRTGFALGSGNFMEDARVFYNNLVRTSTAGAGYTVSDRCLPGPFSKINSYSNTTYYSADGIHCTNLGYGILAAQDRTAILSL